MCGRVEEGEGEGEEGRCEGARSLRSLEGLTHITNTALDALHLAIHEVLPRLHRRLNVGGANDRILDLLAALEMVVLLVLVSMGMAMRAVGTMNVLDVLDLVLDGDGLALSL